MKIKEPEQNFVVFAIVSAEDDYYLAGNINSILSLDLKRIEHPMLKNELSNGKTISCFNCTCPKTNVEYSFICNKYEEIRLIPQLQNIDFILKISGFLTKEQINNIAASIRTVKGITACMNLNVKKTPAFNILERI
ncbi:MAG: IPExxxVDY family protein [Prevotellaceae bacterium]|nr:IPExxxVDY family protein [Prevotellaceae bacterium]